MPNIENKDQNKHQQYIQRCIGLAKNGLGNTYPNPMVGSVVVCEDQIIGQGWHQKAGDPHAEVIAINSVKNKSLLEKSTIYVSLEPCAHFGKTPPCADLIVKSKISKIVIGCVDPFSEVAGKGIEKLLKANCKVITGVLEKECQELNKRFFTFHTKKRPYIILKWAESQDSYIAPLEQEKEKPTFLSNLHSRQQVHQWRSQEQAILVGKNTILKDNPSLTVRSWNGKSPTRIAIGSKIQDIPSHYHILNQKTPTIWFSKNPEQTTGNFLTDMLFKLYQKNLQSIIIEGGRETLQHFIDHKLWDEARIFKTNIYLKQGIPAPLIKGTLESINSFENDQLHILKND